MTRVVWLAAIALACSACNFVHTPRTLSLAERTARADQSPPPISVCIETPIPDADHASEDAAREASRFVDEAVAANTLIESLRRTGLFRSVGFSYAPDPHCDVLLIAHEVPDRIGAFPSLWPAFILNRLSFGVIPFVGYYDPGVRFSTVSAPEDVLRFDWRTRVVSGFPLSLPLAIVPGWKLVAPYDAFAAAPGDFDAALALFLIAHREQIWPRAELAP